MYTLFYAVGGVFFFMPDRIGRRITMLIFSIISMAAQFIIYFSPVFYYKVIGYALYGVSQTKNIVCNVYAVELVHSRDKPFICSLI